MKRLVWTISGLVLGNIIGGLAIEKLRDALIRHRTHHSAMSLEPWEESRLERVLLKFYVVMAWWKIVCQGRRQHFTWREILTDIVRGLADPIDAQRLQQLSYAGL